MLPRSRFRTAFTLIELLLVLALLVVIAGFAMMALEGSLLQSKLRKSVEQVRTAWCDARLQSITSGERTAFTCLVGGRNYRISSIGSLLAPTEGATPETSGSAGELPEGVKFASLQAAPNTTVGPQTAAPHENEGQWSSPVVFNPDGTSYDALLIVELESGRQVQLSLRGLTCTAESADVARAGELR